MINQRGKTLLYAAQLEAVVLYCCDRKSRAACAQSFALWQQATTEFTCHDHSPRTLVVTFNGSQVNIGRTSTPRSLYRCLFAPRISMVLFFTHIPFVVNHTINATPPERLQQYLRCATFCVSNQFVSFAACAWKQDVFHFAAHCAVCLVEQNLSLVLDIIQMFYVTLHIQKPAQKTKAQGGSHHFSTSFLKYLQFTFKAGSFSSWLLMCSVEQPCRNLLTFCIFGAGEVIRTSFKREL